MVKYFINNEKVGPNAPEHYVMRIVPLLMSPYVLAMLVCYRIHAICNHCSEGSELSWTGVKQNAVNCQSSLQDQISALFYKVGWGGDEMLDC